MQITIFAAGSRGDIQPCLALSKGLQQAGYRVRMAAPENFADFVEEHGVEFYPLRGDVEQIMSSDTGRSFMEKGGGNPIKSIRTMRKLITPVVMQMVQDAYDACRDADGFICLGVFSSFGQSIAEALNIPVINVEPTPLHPTKAFPAPSWPIQKNLGSLHNYLSGLLMLYVVWLWYRPFVNAFRQQLGLPPYSAVSYYRTFRSIPMIGAYSSTIIPTPPDWVGKVHVAGYFFLENQPDWQPTPELENFLAAGEPPVYIGFGSMSGNDPEKFSELVLEALAHCGQRGLLLTGWGGLQTEQLPEEVFILKAAPHSWLFPRMAAVVHHGGAGTTAEGLRAGVPTVVVPFVLDQAFWGERIKALGLGPAAVTKKKITAARLAKAIQTAVQDPELNRRTREIGASIRLENGVENAVNLVKSYFGEP